jgi:hypothetical protein
MAGKYPRSWNGYRWGRRFMYGGRVYRYAYHGLYFLEGICICTLFKDALHHHHAHARPLDAKFA